MRAVKTIIFILVCIGLIWLIVLLLGKALSPKAAKTVIPITSLSTYAETDAVTSMYIDGPVRVNQDHQALRVSVTRSESKIELIKGYNGEVVRQEVFENNTESYANFLKALDKAQFNHAVNATVSADERGYCPLQNRFVYTLSSGGSDKVRSWTTSCNVGNFTGNKQLTRRLFLDQIPANVLRDILVKSSFSTV